MDDQSERGRAGLPPSERLIIFLVGAVQFVNVLDFVMVMPMGPDFAKALGIDSSRIGLIGGSYTAAAAVSGLAGSFFLDRYDRRKALGLSMLGLVVGTCSAGLATGLTTLMLARVMAGLFGGPATSLSMAIVADVVPPERRGKAMGAVMGAFSVASVLGVPAGLWIALHGGWRMPFFALSALGLVITAAAFALLPPLTSHLRAHAHVAAASLRSLLVPDYLLSFAMTATSMAAGFVLIPNISTYLQLNLGYPREKLGEPYLFGGIASFLSMRAVGWLVDRFGSAKVGTFGALGLVAVVYLFFVTPSIPVVLGFVAFMTAMAFRNVAHSTLTSRVPATGERARFMSIQSAVQHLASAGGAFLSSALLVERAGRLEGMGRVCAVTTALSLVLPAFMFVVEQRVRRRDVAAALRQPHELMGGMNAPGPGLPRPPQPAPND